MLKLLTFILILVTNTLVCLPMTLKEAEQISDERLRAQIAREKKPQANSRKETDISVMWSRPDLAEEFAKKLILEFSPDPESTIFKELKAKYYTLYKAYIVNCDFNTEDTYGENREFRIQMKIRILPGDDDQLHYEALDLKELR